MSSLLAHQDRLSLPEELVGFLDRQSAGKLAAIMWIEPDRSSFTAYFEKDGLPFEQKVFRYRRAYDSSVVRRRAV